MTLLWCLLDTYVKRRFLLHPDGTALWRGVREPASLRVGESVRDSCAAGRLKRERQHPSVRPIWSIALWLLGLRCEPAFRVPRLPSRRLSEGCHDLDGADQISIEFLKVLSRNPVLLMDTCTDGLNCVARKEISVHLKAQHVACPAVLCVPSPRDLSCVLFVQDRIEQRLIG